MQLPEPFCPFVHLASNVCINDKSHDSEAEPFGYLQIPKSYEAES